MTRPWRVSTAWLASIAVLCVLTLGCSPVDEVGATGIEAEASSDRAPDFTLDVLGGGQISLAELRGKTVVLDFWATWCPPCEFQVPELNAFYDAHSSDSDVAVYGVSVDSEGPDVVDRWVNEKQVHYPILLDGEDLARKFGALGFPTLFVVSPDGEVHTRHTGLIESQTLEEALQAQRARPSS